MYFMARGAGRPVDAGYGGDLWSLVGIFFCNGLLLMAGGVIMLLGGSIVVGRDLLLRERSIFAACWRIY